MCPFTHSNFNLQDDASQDVDNLIMLDDDIKKPPDDMPGFGGGGGGNFMLPAGAVGPPAGAVGPPAGTVAPPAGSMASPAGPMYPPPSVALYVSRNSLHSFLDLYHLISVISNVS